MAPSNPKAISTDEAMNELKEVSEFNNYYRNNFFPLEISQVKGENISATLLQAGRVNSAISSLVKKWIGSRSETSNTVAAGLDELLLETGKLDIQMQTLVIRRLKSLETCQSVIRSCGVYLDDFSRKCARLNRQGPAESVAQLKNILADALDILDSEKQDLIALIERCNLYYQGLVIAKLDDELPGLRNYTQSSLSNANAGGETEAGRTSDSTKVGISDSFNKLGQEIKQLDNQMKDLGVNLEAIKKSLGNVEPLTFSVRLLTLWIAVVAIGSFIFEAKNSLSFLIPQWLDALDMLLFILIAGGVGTLIITLVQNQMRS